MKCFLNFVSYNVTEDNEVTIVTNGDYIYEKNRQVLVAREKDPEFKNNLTTITVENNETVSIRREGDYATNISATMNHRSISQHNTPFGTFCLGIRLTEFESTLGEDGGTLKFAYKTDADFNIVSEIKFSLKIKVLQSELNKENKSESAE